MVNHPRRDTPPIRFALGIVALAALMSAPGLVAADAPAASGEKTASTSAGLVNDWLRTERTAAKDWDIGGQIRVRYEVKEKAGSFPNRDFIARGQDNSNDLLALRTRVHIGYTPASWVNLYVEGRDSHGWWDKREPSPDDDSFDLHQAFFALGNPKQFPLSVKAGRQEMTYGDERLIGVSDWSNTRRVFDAAKVRFENELFWVEAFTGRLVIPRDKHFNIANDYDWFSGVYSSSRKLVPWQDTDLYFLARNVSAGSPNAIAPGIGGPPSRDIYTIGMRVKSLSGQSKGWDYSAEAAGQFGSINSGGVRLEHRALAVDATAGYAWKDAFGSPRLGLGYTYASGDSNPNDTKNETFDLLFGTHRHYGLMDLWNLRNIHAPRLSASLTPMKKLSLSADYHVLWLADRQDFFFPDSAAGRNGNGYGRNPQFDTYVGSELDFIVSYQPAQWAEFQCGYGHFFVGDYIKQSVASVPANGHAVDANWVYVQAKFNF